LLLRCARTRIEREQAERIGALVRGPMDWEYVLCSAARHGVLPLLYRSLKQHGWEFVPKAVARKLQGDFEQNARRSLFLAGELAKVIGLFRSRGIAALPFKGPVLAAAVYGDLALRQFEDLDILVQEGNVRRAARLLISAGFRPAQRLTPGQESVLVRWGWEYRFGREGGQVNVQLHWRIAPGHFGPAIPSELLWETPQDFSMGGMRMHVLGPESLLMVLCAHGTKHCWQRLSWICDVAETIAAAGRFDWRSALARARSAGAGRMMLLGLRLARDVLGAQVGEELSPALQERPVAALAADVRRRLFTEGQEGTDGARRVLFHLAAKERLRDRIDYCLHFVLTPTPPDVTVIALPEWLSAGYFLVRPVRLLAKYGLGIRRVVGVGYATRQGEGP